MENKKWKRFGSCLMALAMVLSGTALPASAATPGKDGSAEMNEAYAAHESLMPIGPSFSVATLLEWTPESDPDARYSRASIPMANREGGFVVNPKANPEAKLMLCSLANSSHDTTSSQGTENFMSWSFNYWQYTDSFVYWSGSEEGLICCPTGEFTDAAHTNGVPVVATLGFPWGSGSGYAEEVDAFCQKAEDGSFPVADKLLEVMDYYGFDGYFFNQLCAHVFKRIFQFDVAGNGYTVIGDGRCAEFLFQNNVTAFRTEGYFYSVSQSIYATLQAATSFFIKQNLFSHFISLL